MHLPVSINIQLAFGGYVFLVLLGSNGLKNVLFSVIGIVNLSQNIGTSVGFGSGGFLLLRYETNDVSVVVGATERNRSEKKIILFAKAAAFYYLISFNIIQLHDTGVSNVYTWRTQLTELERGNLGRTF